MSVASITNTPIIGTTIGSVLSVPITASTSPITMPYGSTTTNILTGFNLPQGTWLCELSFSLTGASTNTFVYARQVNITYTNYNTTTSTENILEGQLIYSQLSTIASYNPNFIIHSLPSAGITSNISLFTAYPQNLPGMFIVVPPLSYTISQMVATINPTITFTRLS